MNWKWKFAGGAIVFLALITVGSWIQVHRQPAPTVVAPVSVPVVEPRVVPAVAPDPPRPAVTKAKPPVKPVAKPKPRPKRPVLSCAKVPAAAYKYSLDQVTDIARQQNVTSAQLDTLRKCWQRHAPRAGVNEN